MWRLCIGMMMAAWLNASAAHAALKPDISTKQIRDFTRITFNWPEKVRFKVDTTDQGVTLTFNQAADINLGTIRQGLGGTLTGSQLSPDGTKITLSFDQPYRIRHFISGNANGIDIIGAEQVDKPTPKPQAASNIPLPSTKPSVPKPKETQVAQAAPEPKAEKPAAPKPAKPVKQEATTSPKPPAETKPEPVAAEEPKPETPPAAAEPEVTEAPEPEPKKEPAAAPPVVTAPDESAPVEAEPIVKTAPEPAPTVEKPIEVVEPEPTPEPAPSPVAEAEPEPEPVDTDEFVDDTEYEPVETPIPSEAQIDATPSFSDERPFIITTFSLATGTEIRFPWVQRTAAAVFNREDAIWVVFDKPRNFNMELFKSILPANVLGVEKLDVPGHTVLRLKTDGTVYARVTQPKNTSQWWVTLSIYRQIPPSPISLQSRAKGPTNPHLFVPSLEYANPVTITDPLIGDELIVVPFFNPGEGVYPSRSYAEMDILPSAQGIAMVKKHDFTEARPLRNGLRLTSREGLSLSSDLPELALAELEALQSESVTWFPYERWRVEPGTLYEVRRELEGQLVNANDVRANTIRLKLAQLYLGEGLGTEALAWLQLIEESDPVFFEERKLMALRGAAYFLNTDYAEAKEHFSHKRLRENEEYKLWRDVFAVLNKPRSRFDYMDYFQTYISKYPPRLREKLGILAADNYANRKSYSRALNTLDTLSLTGIDARTIPYVDFLLGKIAAENGNMRGARLVWEKLVAETDDRFIYARTQFALTNMLYSNGDIDLKEAIERLDQLRIVWRGDSLELSLLNYLGQLYIDDSDYLNGLRAWQEIVRNYPENPLASSVAKEMAKTFNYLYAEGGADELQPLQALSIFYEFRQLTPVGEAGDTMIQALADRLIQVDLLERAGALLEHQIKFRQEKLARSKLGAQLALVYYLNKQAQKSLDTLELTGFGRMPEDLSLKRKRIAALALADIGEPRRAIDMLAPDASREADALRLSIYWKMREWPNVIAVAEALLGTRSDMTAPLSPMETEYLLQLSIAYMFERDRTQLQYLRNYFEPLVADGPNKEIFMFVTNASGPIDPQQFQSVVTEQIAKFESFMKDYRRQIDEGGLSPLVN